LSQETESRFRLSLYHSRVNVQWESCGLGGHVFAVLQFPVHFSDGAQFAMSG